MSCSQRLNILVSTTNGWNPGDDFIREGVQNLIQNVIGECNWFFYNRNPDLDASRSNPVSLHIGHKNIQLPWDLIIFAGTPEWDSWRTKPIIEHLLTQPDTPVMFLGIGSCNPNEKPNDLILSLMKRDQCLVVCRNHQLNKTLVDLGVKSVALPCPALFCSPKKNTKKNGKILVFQDAKSPHNSVPISSDFLQSAVLDGWSLVCHAYSEAIFAMQNNLPFMIGSYHDLITTFSSAEIVVSTRLHGAIAANSSGTPSILTSSVKNYRISTCANLLGIPEINDPQQALLSANKMLADGSLSKEMYRLRLLRDESEAVYYDIIRNFLCKQHR